MSADQAQYAPGASPEPLTRGSERGAATCAGLLAAAREVFASVGDTEAGVTGIVALAGASVGSRYEAAARALADGVLSVIGRIDITSRG